MVWCVRVGCAMVWCVRVECGMVWCVRVGCSMVWCVRVEVGVYNDIYMYPPHPLYHARTPATRDSAKGRYVNNTILTGVVSKNPKI